MNSMSHTINSNRHKRVIATIALVAAIVLGLAACGSSGSSTSTSTNASATTASAGGTSTNGAGRAGDGAGAGFSRFKAVRECLQKNGITLPKRTPGQHQGGGPGGFLGGAGGAGAAGGPHLPSGVSRAQYEAALKKCGGAFPGHGARFQSPAFKQALTKFASCMRENGVNIPAPNTSGNGPIFDTKGIDTASTQFRTAESKCRSDLTGTFHRPGGTPPGGAAPGASG
jgi:hypothetical protein